MLFGAAAVLGYMRRGMTTAATRGCAASGNYARCNVNNVTSGRTLKRSRYKCPTPRFT